MQPYGGHPAKGGMVSYHRDMATILRVTSEWSGFPGGPGFTNLHFRDFAGSDGDGLDPTPADAQSAASKVRSFWEAIQAQLPSTVRVTVKPEVDVLDVATGDLVDSFQTNVLDPTQGDAVGAYTAAAGAVINWRTNGIRNGRRVRGRTFLVPLTFSSFGADGALNANTRTLITDAAAALSASNGSPDLGVYARPTTKDGTDGAWFVVSSSSVPSMSAMLTSRRD